MASVNWPEDRLPVTINFMAQADKCSNHLFKPRFINGSRKLEGNVTLSYNYIFLLQQPGNFLNHIVAHEFAHVLTKATLFSRRITKFKEHGAEWQGNLNKLSHKALPHASPLKQFGFDSRAISLYQSGTPARCRCPGDDGVKVFSQLKMRSKNKPVCKVCSAHYSPVDRDQLSNDVLIEYEYICDAQTNRNVS